MPYPVGGVLPVQWGASGRYGPGRTGGARPADGQAIHHGASAAKVPLAEAAYSSIQAMPVTDEASQNDTPPLKRVALEGAASIAPRPSAVRSIRLAFVPRREFPEHIQKIINVYAALEPLWRPPVRYRPRRPRLGAGPSEAKASTHHGWRGCTSCDGPPRCMARRGRKCRSGSRTTSCTARSCAAALRLPYLPSPNHNLIHIL